MTTQLLLDRDRWAAKINGQLAFLEVAFSALKHADIGDKVLTQMHRAITVIRSTLRNADSPELEAFTCDLEDLVNLLRTREIKLSVELRGLMQRCTHALTLAIGALQRGETGEPEVQWVRDELFSVLLVNAVTVKR